MFAKRTNVIGGVSNTLAVDAEREESVPDEKTISGRCRGDVDAVRAARFERIWQEHRPRVWRLVARLAGSPDLADDLTQEVGLRALQSFGGFRGQSGAFTWLYRIAVNVVNRDRERRRETVGLDAPEVLRLGGDPLFEPEAAAMKADLAPVVRAALDRLPDDLRATLILQVYEQLKYREIAQVLNIPLGTVKSRLHSAVLRLREELDDDAL